MRFEWDENKNQINKDRHGLSFETAALVFQDPNSLGWLDPRYEAIEERWCSLGRIGTTVIFVAYTVEEDDHGEEIIRIISAREATPGEERRYYAG
jgi:uncharacterized DUF497 family protein